MWNRCNVAAKFGSPGCSACSCAGTIASLLPSTKIRFLHVSFVSILRRSLHESVSCKFSAVLFTYNSLSVSTLSSLCPLPQMPRQQKKQRKPPASAENSQPDEATEPWVMKTTPQARQDLRRRVAEILKNPNYEVSFPPDSCE